MRFLLDCRAASRTLHAALIDLGHDVRSANDGYSGASDESLLSLAYREGRIPITEDKDFGELVFLRRLPHPCIVRPAGLNAAGKAVAMREAIDRRGDALRKCSVVVVTGMRVRIRSGARP